MATRLDITLPRTQDERIRHDVCRQIVWESDIQSQEINVEVNNSAVLLSGRVETRLERLEVENAAKAVYGVSSVTNKIKVEPKCVRTNREIADDVIACLQMVTCVLEESPAVSVRDGIVTLRGRVRWNFQRSGAERVADAVVGVRLVRNFLEVEPNNPIVPCRQPNRRRPNSTRSSLNREEPQTASRQTLLSSPP